MTITVKIINMPEEDFNEAYSDISVGSIRYNREYPIELQAIVNWGVSSLSAAPF